MKVDLPPVGWHDKLFMVLLARMRTRSDWFRERLVLRYLNRALVPFKACCKGIFPHEDVQVTT
eukprot:7180156-Prorocentrum_lima.AAC.1